MALEWQRPVSEVIGDRLWLTMVVSVAAIILTWVLALPIGVYSAVRQYSVGDYVATFIGFIGLAVPSFLLALVLMYIGFKYFNVSIGGLFSDEFVEAPWSLAKAWDLAKHLPLPALILGLAGTAQLIRIMRANLLDELRKPYVMTARARGVSERRVILKYPVRVALNPFASTIGYLLPYVVSGSIIVSLVLSLPTVGPLLLQALVAQDMFLAGTIVLLLGVTDRRRHVPVRPAPLVDRSPDPDGRQAIAEPPVPQARRAGEPVTDPAFAGEGGGAVAPGLDLAIGEVAEERISVASQWQLMWWRFRRHKLAMVATVIVALFYLGVIFTEFLAYAPPDRVRGAALAAASAADPLVRRGSVLPARPRADGTAGPGHAQAGVHAGPGEEDPGALLRRPDSSITSSGWCRRAAI